MQLDSANIVAILVAAGATLGNLILSFITYRGQNKTEDRRIGLDEKRLDQEQNRTQTDAATQITGAATSLSGAYMTMMESLRSEVLTLREELAGTKGSKEELELIKGRISDLANFTREGFANRDCPHSNQLCMQINEQLAKMIYRIEEQHVHIQEQ